MNVYNLISCFGILLFMGFLALDLLINEGKIMYEISVVIANYAFCGFAHIPSLAIFIGGTASIVPERTKDISVLRPWALLASNIACLIQGRPWQVSFTQVVGHLS
jgi:CNT family concentrative nucleoside transporter